MTQSLTEPILYYVTTLHLLGKCPIIGSHTLETVSEPVMYNISLPSLTLSILTAVYHTSSKALEETVAGTACL